MGNVIFVDSSVLLCLLNVPRKNSGRESIEAEFNRLLGEDVVMILPLASIIETGNHIAKLDDGYQRREAALGLERILRQSIEQTPPWVVGETRWDSALIADLVDGVPHTALAALHVLAEQMLVGAGDASIIHEARRYKRQTHVPSGQKVVIWSTDTNLNAVWPSALYE